VPGLAFSKRLPCPGQPFFIYHPLTIATSYCLPEVALASIPFRSLLVRIAMKPQRPIYSQWPQALKKETPLDVLM